MMMTKYHSKKTVVDGITFDSQKESKRYIVLKQLERQGTIKGLKLQPRFELLPSFKKNGKTYRKCEYVADFSYFNVATGEHIVEDVKGLKTEVYKLKRKIFEYKYPHLEITEI